MLKYKFMKPKVWFIGLLAKSHYLRKSLLMPETAISIISAKNLHNQKAFPPQPAVVMKSIESSRGLAEMNISPHLLILLLALVLSLKPERLPNLFSKHNQILKIFQIIGSLLFPLPNSILVMFNVCYFQFWNVISHFQTHKELREFFLIYVKKFILFLN